MFIRTIFFITLFSVLGPVTALAQEDAAVPQEPALLQANRLSIARDFVERMKRGFSNANQSLKQAGFAVPQDEVVNLPDGEDLLFQISLASNLHLDAPLLGRVHKGKVLLSLRDFINALEFPIADNTQTGRLEGWYIRENRLFSLDTANQSVASAGKVFKVSDKVVPEGDDLFVPVSELGEWFGFTLTLDVAKLSIRLDSPLKLPVQERLERRNRPLSGMGIGEPELPLLVENNAPVDFPFVDVQTISDYRRPGDGTDNTQSHVANVRTAGDFVGGTLTTQSQLTKEDKLTSFRANYKQESLEPELLGPLGARRFEIGDVNAVDMELDSFNSLGTGMRVTNVHPLRNILRPSTEIRGEAFPGWDVELYREGQLLDTQVVGDDGVYVFDNVDLFSSDNMFRVVLYGPQGEQREEEIYVPVDDDRLSEGGLAYDLTINRQNDILYRKNTIDNDDNGELNISGLVEKPVGDSSALFAGLESGMRSGKRVSIGHAGASTTVAETLLNLNTALEDTGEMAAQLVARRSFGDHDLRSETNVATDRFGVPHDSTGSPVVFSEEFSANGPLGFDLGTREPRYNLNFNYGFDSEGNNLTTSTAGINTSFNRLAVNQQFNYRTSDLIADDALDSITTINGNIGANRLRFVADYDLLPENELDRLIANWRRYLDQDTELDFTVEHHMDPKLTEGRAQVNWFTGFAYLSPGISYNSDNDLAATLTTRFGLARDPQSGDIHMFDRTLTSVGGLSAFVFLDKNGDNTFNEDDEPLPEVTVIAAQNALRSKTDEEGYAFFNRLNNMRLTDVFVDPDSLQDPFWIPGHPGSSVLPREGHVTAMQFPVHMSGEIDGTVYARSREGSLRPMRGMFVSLYNPEGKRVMNAISETDGFYLLSKIPPGDYFLTIDTAIKEESYARPAPQPIKIGYDGTTIYDNKIYIDQGKPDVGYAIMANAETITPDTSKLEGRKYVLNLGSYNSRVMMVLAWYKMKTVHGAYLAGAQLIDKPSESFVNSSGQHVLRVVVPSNALSDAERRCRGLAARDQSCTVEILPAAAPRQVSAETPAKQG